LSNRYQITRPRLFRICYLRASLRLKSLILDHAESRWTTAEVAVWKLVFCIFTDSTYPQASTNFEKKSVWL